MLNGEVVLLRTFVLYICRQNIRGGYETRPVASKMLLHRSLSHPEFERKPTLGEYPNSYRRHVAQGHHLRDSTDFCYSAQVFAR